MKNKSRRFYIFRLLVLFSYAVMAQDEHISQFYMNTVKYNPSFAGSEESNFRISAATRSQWKSITKPYSTSLLTIDGGLMNKNKMTLGGGLIFLTDKAGDSRLTTTEISGVISASAKFSQKHRLSAGIQVGWIQKRISTDELTWDEQYNGTSYDPSRNSNEVQTANRYYNFDVGAGVNYIANPNRYAKIIVALSGNHLVLNKFSFYANTSEKQYRRYCLLFMGDFNDKNTNVGFLPAIKAQLQGPNLLVMAGGLLRYGFGQDSRYTRINKSSSLFVGLYYRYRDALIPTLQYEFKRKVRLGISYDINTSSLRTASSYRGGFEMACVIIPQN